MSALGRYLLFVTTQRAGQIRCNWWSERIQMTGQVECKRVVKWSAILHFTTRSHFLDGLAVCPATGSAFAHAGLSVEGARSTCLEGG